MCSKYKQTYINIDFKFNYIVNQTTNEPAYAEYKRLMSNRRQEEERERIESEISLLERRLASLRVQLQVNQREREATAREN